MLAAAVGILLAATAIAAVAYELGHKDTEPPKVSASTTTQVLPSTAEVRATTTTAPPLTTQSTTSTPSTSTTASSAAGMDTPQEAARSAAVVYFTYGVAAQGYPTFENVIAPSARPSVESMIIGPDYRNAGCSQIVASIVEDPIPNPPTYGWDLRLRYQCPDGPPASSADGTPLPLTENLYIEATVAPAPTGGYWATQIQIVDND